MRGFRIGWQTAWNGCDDELRCQGRVDRHRDGRRFSRGRLQHRQRAPKNLNPIQHDPTAIPRRAGIFDHDIIAVVAKSLGLLPNQKNAHSGRGGSRISAHVQGIFRVSNRDNIQTSWRAGNGRYIHRWELSPYRWIQSRKETQHKQTQKNQ